ncbi:MAG: alpha/beta hydrolase [Planctomycetaceae bacterium]|nr:alpha/beta hydrolase [Planctomycetaceae bacterium]MCP4479031.1 alpha/beta hydrolase [Planctomycetaceae bacterium]MCP4777074.1 alpha/beta hydrolase [Planctomycetaceae bacterium]
MKTIEQLFSAHCDKADVSSLLEVPQGATELLVLAHGAGAGMHHQNMQRIAEAMHGQRIATFRYQFPFRERGGGRDSLEVSLSTVERAVELARKLEPELPLLAGGHSFGGRMTSIAAANRQLCKVRGFVFFAFPLHPRGKPNNERAQHLPDIREPLLFFTGSKDPLFTAKLFKPIHQQICKSATVHILDSVDHGYRVSKRSRESKEDVFEEMGRLTRQWLDEL